MAQEWPKDDQGTLFGGPVAVAAEPVEKLSADRRRTQRQRDLIDAGLHPVTLMRHVGEDSGLTCGNCRFRELLDWHNRTYPKCTRYESRRLSHGAGTAVRAWWPGCTDHELGDPEVSRDAARWTPDA